MYIYNHSTRISKHILGKKNCNTFIKCGLFYTARRTHRTFNTTTLIAATYYSNYLQSIVYTELLNYTYQLLIIIIHHQQTGTCVVI